jgi:hypothetical protein
LFSNLIILKVALRIIRVFRVKLLVIGPGTLKAKLRFVRLIL